MTDARANIGMPVGIKVGQRRSLSDGRGPFPVVSLGNNVGLRVSERRVIHISPLDLDGEACPVAASVEASRQQRAKRQRRGRAPALKPCEILRRLTALLACGTLAGAGRQVACTA